MVIMACEQNMTVQIVTLLLLFSAPNVVLESGNNHEPQHHSNSDLNVQEEIVETDITSGKKKPILVG